ncbi:Transcription elongation factor GreA [subsurface metagenome]
MVSNQQWETLKDLFNQILSHYKEYRECFIWIARNLLEEKWFDQLNIQLEKILIGMLYLLDITFREISNKRDVSQNRKNNKQIQDFLFKDEKLVDFLLEMGEESITRLYTLVEDIKELDPSLKIQLKHRLKEQYTDYKFLGEMEMEKVSMGLLVTRTRYEEKQRDLRQIIEVDIPENSREIGIAMSKGDLSENAEYKAALEKQELLKSTVSRKQEDLKKAQIFDISQVKTETISFGTRAKLKSLDSDDIEEYTILGPWESEPSKNIISYLSPLGVELCNHKKGDRLKFTINKQEYAYIVESIAKTELHQ